ncbi:MAG: hypothetical protein ACYDAI_00455 [Trichloromonadaceae bacterium]
MIIRLVFALLCCLSLALPAHARLTLGVVPSSGGLFASEAQAQQLAGVLGAKLRQEVAVRVFADEATLHDWLNRFRTVDIAVISRSYLSRQAAGEFLLLADYWRPGQQGPAGDTLVVRQGFNPNLMARVQKVLLGLGTDGARAPLLQELRLEGFVLPGERPPPAAAPDPVVPVVPQAAAMEPSAAPAPVAAAKTEPSIETQTTSNPKDAAKPKETSKPKEAAKPKSKEKPAAKTAPKPAAKPAPKATAQPAAKPAPKPEATKAAAQPVPKPAAKPEPKAEVKAAETEPKAAPALTPLAAGAHEPSAPAQEPSPAGGGFYLLLALLLAAMTAAAVFLVRQLRGLSQAMRWFSAQDSGDKGEPPQG